MKRNKINLERANLKDIFLFSKLVPLGRLLNESKNNLCLKHHKFSISVYIEEGELICVYLNVSGGAYLKKLKTAIKAILKNGGVTKQIMFYPPFFKAHKLTFRITPDEDR